jgi:ribosomal protein L40E
MSGTGDVAADPGGSPAVSTQRCQWCGAENPAGATQCATCHALFARPEQDAALRRDLDERLREEQVAHEMYASRRRGLWRLFVR